MVKIEIKYIDRTCLNKKAYTLLIQKYTKGFKNKISIIFDKRIISIGTHYFDHVKKLHIIRISPKKNKYSTKNDSTKEYKLNYAAEKFNLISTTLHELKHAKQFETMGCRVHDIGFISVREISDPDMSEWFSPCELEARIHEYKNIHAAVKYYNSCV